MYNIPQFLSYRNHNSKLLTSALKYKMMHNSIMYRSARPHSVISANLGQKYSHATHIGNSPDIPGSIIGNCLFVALEIHAASSVGTLYR